MKNTLCLILCLVWSLTTIQAHKKVLDSFPTVNEQWKAGTFPLVSADICLDNADFKVVEISAGMFVDDVQLVTGKRPDIRQVKSIKDLPDRPVIVAGTIGHNAVIDELLERNFIQADNIIGQWESYLIETIHLPSHQEPVLAIIGSDRRGTAYGLTSLSEAIGVSPWYWWADVTPTKKKALYLEEGQYIQKSPSVQYRGIFINDERFGGWAKWVEQTFDKETGKVGPKIYQKVFELLLRLKGNYLWPAMHNGSKAFNAFPENAQLADDYAIVMGSSHCEQMLRNNEDEWKNVGTYGDFNYLTNRQTMINYWEERVKTNGKYENIYTLGLRGIHDYPMEGARTTSERSKLMQQAIDDQREILKRNIDTPLEDIPQLLCTYEEVLEAYHAGLEIPEDVTLLWSDDKHGYTRNLCNPEEQKRKGGAGIYYHLSYHGDPASWIWLSPLSPAFISMELTKAYTFGARKIWIFNVGDIKPAEKELSFAMELAWDIEKWSPEKAHRYIRDWFSKIFGEELADEIADIQRIYYKLMAAGKDSHVYFVQYPEETIRQRIDEYRQIANRAKALSAQIPQELQAAYFELVSYPIQGAQMLNEYQLLSRRSMAHAAYNDRTMALQDAERVTEMYQELNEWTRLYNEVLLDGKWNHFFNWRPYHWYHSDKMDAPISTPQLLDKVSISPKPRFLSVSQALSKEGAPIDSETEGEIPLWIRALSSNQNFSKAAIDNIFCHVTSGQDSFDASATPVNNIWHSPHVGPMWSKVGTIHLKKGNNRLHITNLKTDARIDSIFIGIHPPFPDKAKLHIAAKDYTASHNGQKGTVKTIQQLGFSDGVAIIPFDTPSYEKDNLDAAPHVTYEMNIKEAARTIEIRTLPTLRVYEGRDARYAVQLDNHEPVIFSIHTGDFTAEWRLNVLRGYSLRTLDASMLQPGKHTLKIYFLDPGIVLQDIQLF